jgi:hypothetical protein
MLSKQMPGESASRKHHRRLLPARRTGLYHESELDRPSPLILNWMRYTGWIAFGWLLAIRDY